MRILYIDIDSLRPDHLGCYGYHRDTSPNIDRIAAQGVRFTNCYTPDAPCLPSRTALFAGRTGFHTGVVNHGGVAGQPFIEGPERAFRDRFGMTSFIAALKNHGLHTCTLSPFGERHSAWHWYAGFNEVHNPGKGGMENADEVSPLAVDWIQRNAAQKKDWFLHMNFWDPHTPYRVPLDFGDPFQDEPIPDWLTEAVRADHWSRPGPHSAREVLGWDPDRSWPPREDREQRFPRQPGEIPSMAAVRQMFDGYDTGVRYADAHLGKVLEALEQAGVLEDTWIILSADHGENLGELNIYGDHQTADQITCNIPMIVKMPGVTDAQAGRVDASLIYHFDVAATVMELLGIEAQPHWDGLSFAENLKSESEAALRDTVVVSQNAWSCQRGVRWDHWMLVRSYHEGYHGFPDLMLFDLANDPHEQHNLAESHPEVVGEGLKRLDAWVTDQLKTATDAIDPMQTVLAEGGAFHTRGMLPTYLERLRATDRGQWADWLTEKHPDEANV
ncbi:MAG: sulfatase [Opitutales bacterium]